MEENILDWYKNLNEDEEIAKITVPVLDTGSDETDEPDEPEIEKVPDIESDKKVDTVVTKDRQNSLMSFVMIKRIQDLLVRIASLDEPYETDSEERQNMVDTVKNLYIELGDLIGKL